MDVKGGGEREGQNGGDVADDATGAIFHRVVGSSFVRLHRHKMERSTPSSMIMKSPWSENFDHPNVWDTRKRVPAGHSKSRFS